MCFCIPVVRAVSVKIQELEVAVHVPNINRQRLGAEVSEVRKTDRMNMSENAGIQGVLKLRLQSNMQMLSY